MDGKCKCFPFFHSLDLQYIFLVNVVKVLLKSNLNSTKDSCVQQFFLILCFSTSLKILCRGNIRWPVYFLPTFEWLKSKVQAQCRQIGIVLFVSKARTLLANPLIFQIYVPDLTLTFCSGYLKSTYFHLKCSALIFTGGIISDTCFFLSD